MSPPVVFIILVLVCGVPIRRGYAAAPTNADDAAAMLAIANSTGAGKSLGWGVHSPDPCGGTWYGVRCDDAGRVTAINASRAGLSGLLRAVDLGWLTSLTELDLSFNALGGGQLPLLPRPLPSLRVLDLRSNAFLGLPDGFFAAFPALETFAIDDNDMVIEPWIPKDVLTCSNLRSFSANNINLDDPFPNIFGNTSLFPNLEMLSLRGNQMFGFVDPDFGKNSKIKFFDVGAQRKDGFGVDGGSKVGGILQFITGMENIVEFRVDQCEFYGLLPDASHLSNLRVFDAANNDLSGSIKFPPGTQVNLDGNPKLDLCLRFHIC